MGKSMVRVFLVSLAVVLTAHLASAGTYTISAGTGTLTYTANAQKAFCSGFVAHQQVTVTYYQTTYSAFSYSAAGSTVPLSGSVTSTDDAGYFATSNCPKSNFPSVSLTGGGVEVAFTPSGQTGGSAVYEGFINPKYVIVGVMYSPPGSSSTVTYGNDAEVGSSTSVASSFSSTVGQSTSLSLGFSIEGWLGAKETTTESNSYTQEQDSSSSIEIKQTTSSSTGLSGFSDPVHGINHDYDYIFVWLNPTVNFTVSTVSGKTQVQWTGYGYDLDDTPAYPDMDVIGIQLGCLNGNFYQQYLAGTNTNWSTCTAVFNNNFSRSWALNNVNGSGPALTPTLANSSAPYNFCQQPGTDLYKLCQADPFGANPNYTVQFASGATTTADGRFTACGNSGCNSTIEYQPSVNKTYSQGYTTTQTTSQGAKYTYASDFSVESEFTGGASLPLPNGGPAFGETIIATFTNTYSFSNVEEFNQSTNNSNGQTASFSIQGPPEGYTGPQSFVVYQDNLYGTFMFYPVP